MASNLFTEGVKPGGLTTKTEIRILLCYLLDSIKQPVTQQQIEESLLGEELVNYFVLAESIVQLKEQGLIIQVDNAYTVTDSGRTVAQTLAEDVPRSVRESAVNGVIRAQQYAAMQAVHQSEIEKTETGRLVKCNIQDSSGSLFNMQLYMPDDLSAQAVKDKFVQKGDEVYKLMLAALTGNKTLALKALESL